MANEKAPWLTADSKDQAIQLLRERVGELQRQLDVAHKSSITARDFERLKQQLEARTVQVESLQQRWWSVEKVRERLAFLMERAKEPHGA